MTIKRRNKLPKRLKERCKKLRIRITKVRNGKRVYKTKKAILGIDAIKFVIGNGDPS